MNLTGFMEILLLALFCFLGFWKPNAIIFMILAASSLSFGLSVPDILSSEATTTPTDITFAMVLIVFAFLCAGWAFKLMFWRGTENA